MAITEEFKAIIEADIAKCEYEIDKGNKQSRGILHATLVSKYGPIIDGFKNDLRSLSFDDDGSYRKQNLETMRQKLILFRSMEYTNRTSENTVDRSITITNTNAVDINIQITFEEAKSRIENMTSLSETEIQEILAKIDKLEDIYKSSDRKTKKWDNAKEIIKWVAEKGIDVAKIVLPLLLKTAEG